MTQTTTVKKDAISEYVVTNGQEVRPYCGTSFQKGDRVKIHHFTGNIVVGVGLPNEANFRDDRCSYEVWELSGVQTFGTPAPSKTMSQREKMDMIQRNSRYGLLRIHPSSNYDVNVMRSVVETGDFSQSPTEVIWGNLRNLAYALHRNRRYKPYPELWG